MKILDNTQESIIRLTENLHLWMLRFNGCYSAMNNNLLLEL